MKDFSSLFKDDAMTFRNVCHHFQEMTDICADIRRPQRCGWDKGGRHYVDFYGKYSFDIDSLLYCSQVPVIRHVDLDEICDPRNFADMGRMLVFDDRTGEPLPYTHDTTVTSPDKGIAILVAKQLWDVLDENGETEEGAQWLLDRLNRALAAFEEDTPVKAIAMDTDIFFLRKEGCAIRKDELAKMFFDAYLDEEAMEKDLNAEGFLPWLMPWLRNVADWRILPNGTAIPVRQISCLHYVREFLERLVKEIETRMEIRRLEDAGDDELAAKIKSCYMRPHSKMQGFEQRVMYTYEMFTDMTMENAY